MKVRELVVAAALIAASVSVNADVCDPLPEFIAALQESVAMDQAGISQHEKDARNIQLGLTLPDGHFRGWLMVEAARRQAQCVQQSQEELNALRADVERTRRAEADRRAQAFAQLQEQSDRAEASRQQARATAIYQSEQARNRDAAGWRNLANQREQRRQTDAIEESREALRRIERNSQVGVPYRYRW